MPLKIVKQPDPGVYRVRAYCTDCHSLLQESNLLTQKQLVDNWNNTVLTAMQFHCEHCGFKIPNYHIEFRIVDTRFGTELAPEEFAPLKLNRAESSEAYAQLINKLRAESKKEYLDAGGTDEAVAQAMLEAEPVQVDVLEDGTAVLPVEDIDNAIKVEVKRRRHAKERADIGGTTSAVQAD